jgi:hypothetical protein
MNSGNVLDTALMNLKVLYETETRTLVKLLGENIRIWDLLIINMTWEWELLEED